MSVYEKLMKVQSELKAPKGKFNTFGKYNYRSCEDILEAVKPILVKHGAAMVITDKTEQIGERYYIQATATFIDIEDGQSISNSALARESAEKKGMDESQITGTASSYARKYALNGLFLIDDTKDADSDEYHEQTTKITKANAKDHINDDEYDEICDLLSRADVNETKLLQKYGIQSFSELNKAQYTALKNKCMSVIEGKA